MSRLACLTASTAIALCAAAASAQITADDAWAAVQAQYAALGVTLEATPTREGAVLTLGGVTGRLPLPQGLGELRIVTGNVVLTETGDGTVSAAMPPSYRVNADVELLIDGEAFSMGATLDVATADHVVMLSGTPGAVVIETDIGLLEVTLTDIRLPPDLQVAADDLAVDFYVRTEGLRSSMTITRAEVVSLAFAGSIQRTVTDTSFVAGDIVSASVTVAEATSYDGSVDFPAAPIDLANLAAALRGGLDLAISTTTGATVSQAVSKSGGLVVTDQGQSLDSLVQNLTLGPDGIDVLTAFTGLDLSYTITDLLPMPLGATLAEGSVQFAMPLLAGPEASPARLAVTLRALEGEPAIWDLIGPGASAMSGPLDLTLDMSAMLRWRTDILDVMGLVGAVENGQIVAEVPSFALDTLQASFGGASVTGSGAGTLDWTGVDAMFQLGDPVGQADYVITGANILLDRLAGTGLVGPQEMMGLRGGLAMAGRPTGPDELTGAVTFGPDGLRLNGVRVD